MKTKFTESQKRHNGRTVINITVDGSEQQPCNLWIAGAAAGAWNGNGNGKSSYEYE